MNTDFFFLNPAFGVPEYQAVVLLVDDQVAVADDLRRALAQQTDITFHYCPHPVEALAVASQIKPSVILLDLDLPQRDGLTLLRQFRANPITRPVPIIVLYGTEDPRVRHEAFAGGANDCLVKLPNRLELLARLRYHSRAYLNQWQRDEAFRALRRGQHRLLEHKASLTELNRKLDQLNRQLTEATQANAGLLTSLSREVQRSADEGEGRPEGTPAAELTERLRRYAETIHTNGEALLAIAKEIAEQMGGALGGPDAGGSVSAVEAAAPLEKAAPPVEAERFRDMTGGDPAFEAELIGLFCSQVAEHFDRIQNALAAGQASEVALAAHKGLGACTSVGAVAMAPSLRELERLGNEGQLTKAWPLLDETRRQFARVKEWMERRQAPPATENPL